MVRNGLMVYLGAVRVFLDCVQPCNRPGKKENKHSTRQSEASKRMPETGRLPLAGVVVARICSSSWWQCSWPVTTTFLLVLAVLQSNEHPLFTLTLSVAAVHAPSLNAPLFDCPLARANTLLVHYSGASKCLFSRNFNRLFGYETQVEPTDRHLAGHQMSVRAVKGAESALNVPKCLSMGIAREVHICSASLHRDSVGEEPNGMLTLLQMAVSSVPLQTLHFDSVN